MRVAPPLIAVALRTSCRVLLKAVAVTVAIPVDPLEAALRGVSERRQGLGVPYPTVVFSQQQQIQRSGVGSPVVRAVREEADVSPLVVGKLMRYLTRYGIT